MRQSITHGHTHTNTHGSRGNLLWTCALRSATFLLKMCVMSVDDYNLCHYLQKIDFPVQSECDCVCELMLIKRSLTQSEQPAYLFGTPSVCVCVCVLGGGCSSVRGTWSSFRRVWWHLIPFLYLPVHLVPLRVCINVMIYLLLAVMQVFWWFWWFLFFFYLCIIIWLLLTVNRCTRWQKTKLRLGSLVWCKAWRSNTICLLLIKPFVFLC